MHIFGRDSPEILAKILDSSSDWIFYLGPDLKIRFANQAFSDQHREVEGGIIGKHLSEIYSSEMFETFVDYCVEAASGKPQDFTLSTTENGSPSHIHAKLVPNIDNDGTVDGIFGYCTDQTPQSVSERNFELALKSQSVAFWELRPSLDDWILTEHIENLLGLSTGYLNNSIQLLLKRIHPSDRSGTLFKWISDSGQGSERAKEFRCRTSTDEYRWYRVFGNRETDSDDKTLSLAGTITDINDLKNAEILAANRLKHRDSFLSMLSHELRNPLAGIQYAVDYFDNDAATMAQLSPGHKTSLDIVKRQTAVITRLLNDLLNVSRVTQNQIQFEEETLEFSELLGEILEGAKAIYTPKRQTLKVSCDARTELITGDRVRLTQAFTNLIDNASKFSDPNSQIEVTCIIVGDSIVTSICDSGIGINPEAVDNIFDLFFREEQALEQKDSGLGVGLYLVKKIVDAHQGSVKASSPGKLGGSDFQVKLPIKKTLRGDQVQRYAGVAEKLVLIEDNEDARLALSMALSARGFDVSTFKDGQTAIESIPDLAPSVVLIDIGLPGKDGLKVIEDLRGYPTLKDTYFVALTGYSQTREQEILKAGFHNHMVKPVNIKQICKMISSREIAPS